MFPAQPLVGEVLELGQTKYLVDKSDYEDGLELTEIKNEKVS